MDLLKDTCFPKVALFMAREGYFYAGRDNAWCVFKDKRDIRITVSLELFEAVTYKNIIATMKKHIDKQR